MIKIIIREASFLCNVGVTKKEREIKQKILIDLELSLDIKNRIKDNIKNTIDYSKVHEVMKEIVEKNDYKLIETIAEGISTAILRKFPIENVFVRVKKPRAFADKNVKYVAVEMIKERNG